MEDPRRLLRREASRAEVASILESLLMLGLVVAKREGDRVRWSAVKIA